MSIETMPYDVADQLTHPEDQLDLIVDAVATGDPAVIRDALNIVARARGMTRVARAAGVTREALYKALGPDGDPRMSTLLGVFGALGVRLLVTAVAPPPADKAGDVDLAS